MPAHYLVESVEGDTPEHTLAAKLQRIVQQVRHRFGLGEDDVTCRRIQETLHVVPENGLAPARDMVGLPLGYQK